MAIPVQRHRPTKRLRPNHNILSFLCNDGELQLKEVLDLDPIYGVFKGSPKTARNPKIRTLQEFDSFGTYSYSKR